MKKIRTVIFAVGCLWVIANSMNAISAAPSNDFGTSKSNPVEVCRASGEVQYLEELLCPDGRKATYTRNGSVGQRNPSSGANFELGGSVQAAMERLYRPLKSGEIDSHMIDSYKVMCGAEEMSVYLDMYHCEQAMPNSAPSGLQLKRFKDGAEDSSQGAAKTWNLERARALAEKGGAEAQADLAGHYFMGDGVKQDHAEAAKWLRMAAAQGNSSAQGNVGMMHGLGLGVPQDDIRAYMWAMLSAITAEPGSSRQKSAIRMRNLAATQLTPQQIFQAEKMARDCRDRKFKECD
jgi:hypothetical protein